MTTGRRYHLRTRKRITYRIVDDRARKLLLAIVHGPVFHLPPEGSGSRTPGPCIQGTLQAH